MRFRSNALVATMVAGLCLSCGCAGSMPDEPTRTHGVWQKELSTAGIALRADETVVARFVKRYPLLGQAARRYKILDSTTMRVREVVLDDASSEQIRLEDLRAELAKAWIARHGHADPRMVKRLANASSDKPLVAVAEIKAGTLPALRKKARALGAVIRATHGTAVDVEGAPAILAELARLPELRAISLAGGRRPLALNMAKDVGQEVLATAHRVGWGEWIRMAVWEPEACINRRHQDFKSLTWEPRYKATCSTWGDHAGGHSSRVAGVLAADRGSTSTAGLFAGHMFDVDAQDSAAVNDMWARSPHIVNASFTITPFDATRIDQEVYARGTFVFNGAGNDPSDTANCYAYNALCVGGYSMAGTTGQFSDDSFAPGASSINDPSSGREGPQVVGPWYGKKLPHYNSTYLYLSEGGTSYATPAIAGLAGLLLANYPFQFWKKPALMRAVLMASAQAHPITAGNNGKRIPNFNDTIDDKAGVGAPNGDRAKRIVDGGRYLYRTLTPSTLGQQMTISAGSYQRVRVVVAWDQCPGWSRWDPELFVDLDLVIEGPGGTTHYQNLSSADNYEVVEFLTWGAGDYKVHLSAPRWLSCPAEGNQKRVRTGIAWTTESWQPVFKMYSLF